MRHHIPGTHHFVVQLLCRDVGGQHAVGAGVQQTPDEGLLRGGGVQLEHLEGRDLDDPVWSQAHALHLLLLILITTCAAAVAHLKVNLLLSSGLLKVRLGPEQYEEISIDTDGAIARVLLCDSDEPARCDLHDNVLGAESQQKISNYS